MRAFSVLLAVCVASQAWAGWRQITTLAGTPEDITVTDAGVVVTVASGASGGVTSWRATDAGVSQLATVSGSRIGGAFVNDACVVGVDSIRNYAYTTGCGPASGTFGSASAVWRVRATPELLIATTEFSFGSDRFSLGPVTGPFTNPVASWLSPESFLPRSLQLARAGSVDLAVASGSSGTVVISVDGGVRQQLAVSAFVRDAAPFTRLGAPAIAALNADGGIFLVTSLSPVMTQPVTQPAGVGPSFIAMAGRRGLASSATGVVLSPLPDPARPGEVWVERPDAGGPGLAGRVHCIDERFCAALAGQTAWLLENAAAPTGALALPAQVHPGDVLRLVTDAGDGDGDPLWVAWAPSGAAVSPVAGVVNGSEVELTVPSGATCGASISITATLTDGYAPYDLVLSDSAPVVVRGDLEVRGPTSIPAGSGDAGFQAFVDGGCVAATLAWSADDGQTGSGDSFSWAVPATECTAAGRTVDVTVTANWAGEPATQVVVPLQVLPWGAPPAPTFAAGLTQRAGSAAFYLPAAPAHVCEASPGFPGVELLLETDAGVTLAPADGGVWVTIPPACVASAATITARRQVVGEAFGRVSGPGALQLDVSPELDPLGPGANFTITAGADGGVLLGDLLAMVSCARERGLGARVEISRAGMPVVQGDFEAPGPWALPVGCLGGTWDVTATLTEDGGASTVTAMTQVTTTDSQVELGELSVSRIDVVCGAGAAAPVELQIVPGGCAAADFAWRATAGPELDVSSGAGRALTLQTRARDFSMVGERVELTWTVDAGASGGGTATRELELAVQPFLEASVRLEPAIILEESAFRVRTRLRNPTACDVSGVLVSTPLGGATPLRDTALVGGARALAEVVDGALVVRDVAIPAGGELELEFSARPRLLSTPRAAVSATLGGYLVSVDASAPAAAASGCGCGALPAGGWAVWLALAALSRRRRK